MHNSAKKGLLASAFSESLFFLAVGPMFGIVIQTVLTQLAEDNIFENLFMFVVFGYLFGALPAMVAGFVFGLATELLVKRDKTRARFWAVFITCLAGMAAASVFFSLFGIVHWIVPLMALVASLLCSFIRIREINAPGKK